MSSNNITPTRYYSHYTPHHKPHHHPLLHHLSPPPVTISFRRRRHGVRMDSSSSSSSGKKKDKVVVILGATGCGKTRVSVDLATRFPSEIINSDKMQVYDGLDITTNKITPRDRRGVPHHLLGAVDPDAGEFAPLRFRVAAGMAVSDIASRDNLPLVVGGSNSFIHALVVDRFRPGLDVFSSSGSGGGGNPAAVISTQLRYDCCFLWVDVAVPVLCDYLCRRVDEMLDSGMFEELSLYYESGEWASQPGLRKAIGVPEFEKYFTEYGVGGGDRRDWDPVRRGAYEDAVREIKDNTCRLAKRQIGKIMRLKRAGWDLQRVDATEVFRQQMMTAMMTSPSEDYDDDRCSNNHHFNKNSNIGGGGTGGGEWPEEEWRRKRWMEVVWEREVLEPSVKIVKRFLEE
ncbi:hypothetical protein Tsubulata_043689 [Turnera subulata]|uniref:Adenylate isopentenyltransferase n=1 Tax=Turnera subulata TaxID=218843 RepID=A0A9Q0G5B8_9ROSI|nr:hypothetical protein Tsubulata_043689 [Turnera subulata]